MFDSSILINSTSITEKSTPFLVAEIGINHNKDISLAKEMITAAKESGANAVKFQSYTTEKFINPNIKEAESLFKVFQKYELSFKEHQILFEYAKKQNILCFSTPLSLDWIKKLERLQTPLYKIASGDLNNYQLLKEVIKTQKPIIVSTGNSTEKHIKQNYDFFKYHNFQQVAYLHCVSIYPTPIEKLHLKYIQKLKSHFSPIAGFSDHSSNVYAPAIAVGNGATIIEKHFTIDKSLKGPDHAISSTPKEFKKIRELINQAHIMLGDSKKIQHQEESIHDFWGKRSLYSINNTLIAMRPRQEGLPKDEDYIYK